MKRGDTLKRISLFCFPFAGGSSAAYNKWRSHIDKHIELHLVELAGRGRRIYEPHYESIEACVDDLFNVIRNDLNKHPYAFFGHSMGAIIAYELALKIKKNNLPEPIHIFFSGRSAPHIPDAEPEMYYLLPENEFKEKIVEIGGTPREFLDHPELMEALLPMIKNDFRIAELYKYIGEIVPLDYDISVLIGKDEDVTAEQMHEWRRVTKKICSVHYFEGEHFFINEHIEQVVKLINNTLLPPSQNPHHGHNASPSAHGYSFP